MDFPIVENNNNCFLNNPLSQPHEIKNPYDIKAIPQLDASLNELPYIGVNRSNSINGFMPDYQKIILEKFNENEITIREFIKCKDTDHLENRKILIDKNDFIALFKIEDSNLVDLIFHHFEFSQKSNFGIDKFDQKNNNKSTDNKKKNKNNNDINQYKIDIDVEKSASSSTSSSSSTPSQLNVIPLPQQSTDETNNDMINDNQNISSSLQSDDSQLSSNVGFDTEHNNSIGTDKDNILKRPIAGSFPIETPSFYQLHQQQLQNTDSQSTSVTNSPQEEEVQFLSTTNNTPTTVDVNRNLGKDDDINTCNSTENKVNSSNSSSSSSSSNDNSFDNKQSEIIDNSKKKSNSSVNKKEKKLKKRSSKKDKEIKYVNLFDIINQVYLIMSNRGTKEERIKSAFNFYDIYNRGFINRIDLKNVLFYRIKQNNLTISDLTLENLVDNIFEQFDKNGDGIIDFNEFREEMIQINTDNHNSNTMKQEVEKKDKTKVKTYFNIEGIKILYILIILALNVGVTIWSYFIVSNSFLALHLFGYGLYVTRISAGTIRLNASFLLLTMCKQIFTWIRSTRFRSIVPVDKYLTFHKIFALFFVLASLVHTVGWFFGMGIASTKPDYVFFNCLFPHFTARPTVWAMIFLSVPGITGFLMLAILIVMMACSFKTIRKKYFEGFYYTHHLFIIFYILLIVHGSQGWISPPSFWKWFVGPAVLYTLDRGFRLFRKTHRVTVVNFSLKNSRVINLTFTRPSSFRYKPGQYLLINVPQISKLQWHPFTITSSPIQDNISVHIRVTGGWTKTLFEYLQNRQQKNHFDLEMGVNTSPIEINIDGPFGSSSQYALNEKQIILVGAGIGVAPMASLLQDIKLKKDLLKNRSSGDYGASNEKLYDIGNLEKVHFFWLNRDPNCFQWFEELLMEIALTGNQTPKISVHTFTTQCKPKNDARLFMLWNGIEKFFKHQGLDPTTNLPFKTHWGRPNWDAIFNYYSNKYPGETIGLFCCGPPELSKELYSKCKHFTSLKGTIFKFHKENF